MRLLIVTQAVDLDDPVLGFFHRWVEELAARCESVLVVCLSEGRHQLPDNVHILSLGKDVGRRSRLSYALRFCHYIYIRRHEYDAVFVHMNPEYVVLGGLFWRQWGKRAYLWRNHYKAGVLTRIAIAFADTVFCTSKSSFTARFEKTMLMPVGVDIVASNVQRVPRSILFLARFAPSKHPDVLVDALTLLSERGVAYRASFYGSPLTKDEDYARAVRAQARALTNVTFCDGVPHEKTPDLYAAHDIFVNMSGSGMYDKTIFEAAAAGCLVVASSRDFAQAIESAFTFEESDAHDLATVLERVLALPTEEKEAARERLRKLAQAHSVPALADQLVAEMHSSVRAKE